MNETFDAYSDGYEAIVQDSVSFSGLEYGFFLQAKADLLKSLVADRLGADRKPAMLDVGCGVGRLHPYLAPLACELSGTDVSTESLARASHDNPGVSYRQGDGDILPWGDLIFDLTIASCVLHHVPPSRWLAFVAEMRRVTRPGGLVVLIEHNPWNPLTRFAVSRCPFDDDAVLVGSKQGRSLLEAAGLRRVESRHFLLLPLASAPARSFEKLLSRLPLGAQHATFGEPGHVG